MQLAKIKHGRLAMVAVIIYCLAEFILKEGIIDEVESFLQMPSFPSFFPMLSPTAEMLETEFFVEQLVAME
jgi:Chlorophyll A-B binding protein